MTIHPARAKHGNYKPVTAKEPLVIEMMQLLDSQPVSDFHIGVHSGVAHQTISTWRNGHCNPRLDLMQAVLNSIGYELKIVRKK